MAAQSNCTTLEPMTEAEAMQAARENMVYLEQFAYLVWNLNEKMPFSEARKKAIKVAEEKGDDFVHYAVPEEIYPPETMLAYCFPELSEKNIAAVLKWKRKRDRARMRSEGRRSRGKNLWRIFGEAWHLAKKYMACRELLPGQDEGSPREHLNTLEKEVEITSAFQRMLNRRNSGRRSILPTMATYRPRTSSRSHRSPVRSAAKSGGDDGGGDSESDPGDPPGPKLTVPSLQTFLFNHQLNSSILSRTPHPCSWCMERRWAA